MWRKRLQVSSSGKDERKKAIGKDMNFFVEKRERPKSRIYSIPCKRKRRNQPSEQLNLGIVKQVLPITNTMIARTFSRGKNETKIQSIKAGVTSLANAHEKRAQKDGSHTTGATNILRPFFHAHHQQSDDAKKKPTTKIHPSVPIRPTRKHRSIKSNVNNSIQLSKMNCKDDVKNKDLQKKSLTKEKRTQQTITNKNHRKQTPPENSYLCEQSIKKVTEPKIMSTKRKISQKVPPINSKRGISERFRKRIRLVTTDLTSGPEKNDHELGSASRIGGRPARKKLSSLKRKRLQETTDKLRHKKKFNYEFITGLNSNPKRL